MIASVDAGTEKGSPDTLSGIQISIVSRMDISPNTRNRTVMMQQSHSLGFSLKGVESHVLKRHMHVTSSVQAQGSLAHATPPPVHT